MNRQENIYISFVFEKFHIFNENKSKNISIVQMILIYQYFLVNKDNF